MNTVLKILLALILLPMACCGALTCVTCVAVPVAGTVHKAKMCHDPALGDMPCPRSEK